MEIVIFPSHEIIELNEIIHIKCSKEFLVHINISAVNVSSSYLVNLNNYLVNTF